MPESTGVKIGTKQHSPNFKYLVSSTHDDDDDDGGGCDTLCVDSDYTLSSCVKKTAL